MQYKVKQCFIKKQILFDLFLKKLSVTFFLCIFVKKINMEILRLKELMAQKGMSREELANKVGVSMTTISNINSEKNLPTIHLLLQIAEALDIDIREMFVPTKGNIVTEREVFEAKELIKKGLNILEGKI
jgi:DNA-binding XRE family transcriptional regulator